MSPVSYLIFTGEAKSVNLEGKVKPYMSSYFNEAEKDTTYRLSNAFDGDVMTYIHSGVPGDSGGGADLLDGGYHWLIFELKARELQVVESVEIVPARSPGKISEGDKMNGKTQNQ